VDVTVDSEEPDRILDESVEGQEGSTGGGCSPSESLGGSWASASRNSDELRFHLASLSTDDRLMSNK
jgi:hypothetical protein